MVESFIFSCQACGWTSKLVEGDTPSFAPKVYVGGRTQTRRNKRFPLVSNDRLQQLKKIHQRLIPWRRFIFRDSDYWRAAILPLRHEELHRAQTLLAEVLQTRKKVLLEMGVGHQDHLEFYCQIAEYVICSDIYRDSVTAQVYDPIPWVQYYLINVENLPLQDSSVDILFTSHVVEHFPQRIENLNALYRILKPGAIACHIVPIATGFALGHLVGTVANILTLTPLVGRGIHGEYDSVWQELRQTTVKAWKDLFENCGFEILRSGPGTLGLRPLRPSLTLWLANNLHIFGSWVFVMRTVK